MIHHLRGAKLISPAGMNWRLHGWWRWRAYDGLRLGEIWLPRRLETRHILILGDQGSGKTTLLLQLLEQFGQRQTKCVVVDPEGELTAKLYRPERGDWIANPLDERGFFWNPWAEIRAGREAEDVAALVASMIRDRARSKGEQYYQDEGRKLLSRSLHRVTTIANLEAEITRAKGDDKDGKAEAATAIQPFKVLPLKKDCKTELSFTSWAAKPRGWLFFNTTESSRELVHGLQGIWLDLLIHRLLDRDIDSEEIVVAADEVATLKLQPNLQVALTRGRKRGIAAILSLQTVSQLREIYGYEPAKTIAGQPKTKVLFACEEPDTAHYESELIGKHYVMDGRLQREVPLVAAGEIQTLKPFTAYCITGGYRTKIRVSERHLMDLQLGYIPRRVAEPVAAFHQDATALDKLITMRWNAVKLRTQNPKHVSYRYYGALGVELRFSDKYAFAKALGPPPTAAHIYVNRTGKVIDTKTGKPSIHYEEGNIEWADIKEQNEQREFKGARLAEQASQPSQAGSEGVPPIALRRIK